MTFQPSSFKEWVNHLSGLTVGFVGLSTQFYNVDGEQMKNDRLGHFTWGPDEVELDGLYNGNMTGSGIRWAAFLYLKYLRVARKRGWTPGPFEDLWNEAIRDALEA